MCRAHWTLFRGTGTFRLGRLPEHRKDCAGAPEQAEFSIFTDHTLPHSRGEDGVGYPVQMQKFVLKTFIFVFTMRFFFFFKFERELQAETCERKEETIPFSPHLFQLHGGTFLQGL